MMNTLDQKLNTSIFNVFRTQVEQQLTALQKKVDETSRRVDLATAVKPRRRVNPFKILQMITVLVGALQITAFVFNLLKRRTLPPPSPPKDDYHIKHDD